MGWIKVEGGWEIHPWGPWARGYLVPEAEAPFKSFHLNGLRLLLFAIVTIAFSWSLVANTWWPLFHCAWIGSLIEGMGIRWIFRLLPRVKPLGIKAGIGHLRKWAAFQTFVRVVSVLALALTLYSLYLSPTLWEAYLLLVAIICLQFFLNYFETL